MSKPKPNPFGPYQNRAELVRGRRTAVLQLAVAVAAAFLAVVADRVVQDERLVNLYLGAGVLFFVAGLAAAIRWSATPAFEPAD